MDSGNGIIIICQVIKFLNLIWEKFCLQALFIQDLMHQLDYQFVCKPCSKSVYGLHAVKDFFISRRCENLRMLHLQVTFFSGDFAAENKAVAFFQGVF